MQLFVMPCCVDTGYRQERCLFEVRTHVFYSQKQEKPLNERQKKHVLLWLRFGMHPMKY